MTTQQTIAKLQPLRADVSKRYRAVIDKLIAGSSPEGCQGRMDAWRNAVRVYLDALRTANVDAGYLESRISELDERLERGFTMPDPGGVQSWRLGKHFENLLAELEVCCDLQAGYDATRDWCNARDKRLRYTLRRYQRPMVTEYEPLEAAR